MLLDYFVKVELLGVVASCAVEHECSTVVELESCADKDGKRG